MAKTKQSELGCGPNGPLGDANSMHILNRLSPGLSDELKALSICERHVLLNRMFQRTRPSIQDPEPEKVVQWGRPLGWKSTNKKVSVPNFLNQVDHCGARSATCYPNLSFRLIDCGRFSA